MVQHLEQLKETASQTAGPYVHIGCMPNFAGISGVYETDLGSTMVNDRTRGQTDHDPRPCHRWRRQRR